MNERELLIRVWNEYGLRGDLSVALLEEIENYLAGKIYTCGCPAPRNIDSLEDAYCKKHNKPVTSE